ncbi:hypothetical protein GCM10017706_26480 [Lactococcus lactis subsp. hordniae]
MINEKNLLTKIQVAFQNDLWINRTDEFFVNQFNEVEVKRSDTKVPTSLFLNSIKLSNKKEYVFQFSCDVWIENFFELTRSDAFLMLTLLSDNKIIQNASQKMLGSKMKNKYLFLLRWKI